MASSDCITETRLLIAHSSILTNTTHTKLANMEGCLLSLRHPKSGSTTCYAFINGSLQELHWFKQLYGSWFLGDYVCEDGGLYAATPVDPIFLLLPIFEEARMKKGNDRGKFRQLDEIIYIEGFPGYQNLLPIAENSMQVVCEVKEIGSSKFFRLDDSKVLAWLCCKVDHLKLTLKALDQNYATQDEKDTLIDIVLLLGEYMNDEPWLHLLCSHLWLDIQEVTRRVPVTETFPVPLDDTQMSTPTTTTKNGNEKNTSGNRKQPKRMKVETGSLNIKDMFSKASRSRT
ncbi:hypothetical protein MRB53_028712 [Persea americana]|uniref:Uncharacterized protein n=1 Tax=Persea americana TaxID=3435 RepID=A0ACC2KGG9_PERAE|nr:hypothetical protein MRB53_028712 [Persea americana]